MSTECSTVSQLCVGRGAKLPLRVNASKHLWEHFRNGLTHGFAVRHGGFEGNPGQPYFEIKGSSTQPYLSVNPARL